MRTSHRIGIGLLVGLFFAAGIVTRLTCVPIETSAAQSARRVPILGPGTTVASVSLEGAADLDFRPLETLIFVVNSLRQHFVEPITADVEGKMTYDALKGMLAKLDDPNSRFLEPAQREVIDQAGEGTFHGIGAMLAVKRVPTDKDAQEHLVVVAPLESGPAQKAGLLPGDDIIAVDGKSVLPFDPYQRANEMVRAELAKRSDSADFKKRMDAEKKRIDNGIGILDAEKRLTGEDEKPFDLTIVRKGSAKPVQVKVTPRQFTVEAITARTLDNGHVAYARINCFTPGTGTKLEETLKGFDSPDVKGLVLDLRDAAGGQLDQAVDAARPFLAGKKLATVLESHGRKAVVMVPAKGTIERWNRPVVVLVNAGTARMAEVLAAALRDSGSSRLVGEKTYGDFNYSTLIKQRDGSAVILTTGQFITSAGGNYNKKGLPVDVTVSAAGTGDPQLTQAVKLISAEKGRS